MKILNKDTPSLEAITKFETSTITDLIGKY